MIKLEKLIKIRRGMKTCIFGHRTFVVKQSNKTEREETSEVRTRAYSRLKGRIYIGKPCTEPKMEGERISGKWPDEWRRGETFAGFTGVYHVCLCKADVHVRTYGEST